MSWAWLALGLAVWLAGITAAALLAGARRTGRNSSSRMTTIGTRAATHGDPPPLTLCSAAPVALPFAAAARRARLGLGTACLEHRAEDAGPPSPGPQHDHSTTDHHARSIVTSTYRYKRPPRKRKAVPLEGPAIVTPRSKAASASVPRGVKPGNDNRPAEQPAAIVTARKPRGRKAAWARRRRRDTGEREGVPGPHGPARRVIAPRRLGMTARPIPRVTGAATAPSRCRPAGKPWTSRSGRSRRGSCGSPATGAGGTARSFAARANLTLQLVPASVRNSSNTGPFSAASSARMARAAGPPSITRWSTER